MSKKRNRTAGGGLKLALEKEPGRNDVFLALINWINLTCATIGSLLAEQNFKVSRNIVRRLLKKNGYVKCKSLKNKAPSGQVNRNAQFDNIAKLSVLYTAAGNPDISEDTKKKKVIGNLFRDDKVYDHNFPSLAEGIAVPHTFYEIECNEAYVNIETGRDTSNFFCDSIRH